MLAGNAAMTGAPKPTTQRAIVSLVFSLVFFAVTLGIASIAFTVVTQEQRRLDGAVRVPGTVLGLVNPCEGKVVKRASSCWPHVSVRFVDTDGRDRQFLNPTGSTNPTSAPGDAVTVIHPVGAPGHAELYSAFTEWFLPAVTSTLALLFGIASVIGIAQNVVLWRNRVWLGKHGMHVEAGDVTLIRVANPVARAGSGYRPFVVVARWRDPRTAAPYTFRSDPLYDDPTAAVRRRPTIGVLIDPDRPSRYWMEIGLRPDPAA